MVGYIYLNTDLKTGKQYAGKHHYNKEGELDPNYHGSGVLWTKVLKKRPKELIKEEYIKTCYSEEEMNSDEQYYIEFFDTLYPNGYNLTKGGDGGVHCEETRKKMSEIAKNISDEHRKKLSESAKGRIFSDEHRKKLSEAHKKICGEKHPLFGKHRSDETRKKLSKKVLQFSKTGELIREWPSIQEIERNTGYGHGTISRCCNGKQKSAYGFLWKFK